METKNCPFCGSIEHLVASWAALEHTQAEHLEYAVWCLKCGADGPNALDESGAIEGWNLRRGEKVNLAGGTEVNDV